MVVDYWPQLAPVAQQVLNQMIPIAKEILGLERAPILAGNYPDWTGRRDRHRFQLLPVDNLRVGLINIDAQRRVNEDAVRLVIPYYLGLAALYQRNEMFEDNYRRGSPYLGALANGVCQHARIAINDRLAKEDKRLESVARRSNRQVTGWFTGPGKEDYLRIQQHMDRGRTLSDIIAEPTRFLRAA